MTTLLEGLRQIVGVPNFYIDNGGYSSSWDYGAMIEYLACVIILCVVVSSVFRLLGKVFGR